LQCYCSFFFTILSTKHRRSGLDPESIMEVANGSQNKLAYRQAGSGRRDKKIPNRKSAIENKIGNFQFPI
jgi:hypothetical protein